MSRKVEVEIIGDASSYQRAMRRASGASTGFGLSLKRVAAGAGLAVTALGVGRGLAGIVRAGVSEWRAQEETAAQTAAAIKSTGGAANVTAKQFDALNNMLLKKTGIDDEVIASGGNILLTFKNLRNEVGKGNDIFNQAETAMLDLATAMHIGPDQAALQLGKALNDPARGMMRLQRIGVTFTDQQKDLVKHLMETGDTMGAQKVILAELTSEFGGSAAAIGATLSGRLNLLREELRNFAGEVVTKMIPTLEQLVAWFQTNWPAISAQIQQGWDSIRPVLQSLGELFAAVVGVIRDNWGTIGPIITTVATIIKTQLAVIAGIIKVFADLLRGDWSAAWNDVKNIATNVLDGLRARLQLAVQTFGALALALGRAILSGIQDGAGALAAWVGGLMDKTVGAIRGAVGSAFSAAAAFGSAILRGVESSLSAFGAMLVRLIKVPLNAIIGAWNAIGFEFDLPSFDTHIPGVGKVGGGHIGFHVPQIPQLATGGVIAQSGIAMVHKGETVLPAGAGGGVIHNHIYLDGKEIFTSMQRYAARDVARGGAGVPG